MSAENSLAWKYREDPIPEYRSEICGIGYSITLKDFHFWFQSGVTYVGPDGEEYCYGDEADTYTKLGQIMADKWFRETIRLLLANGRN